MAGIFNKIPTDLDLNGPILSFSSQPTGGTGIGTGAGGTQGASISMTGIATAIVGSAGTGGNGYISYQWYEGGVALSDGTYITGTASTGPVGTAATLTISNLITPTDNNRKFYLVADYVPSYTVGVQSSIVPGYTTGNAWNEPLSSGIATVTVTPLIDIIAQPTNSQTLVASDFTPNVFNAGEFISLTVNADLTDSAFTEDLQYQWYLNGEEAVDGTKTVTTTTGSNVSGEVSNFYSSQGEHTFPSIAIENVELTLGGGSGGNGGRDGGGPGGSRGLGKAGKFTLTNSEFVGKTVRFYIGLKGNDGSSGSCGNEYGRGAIYNPDAGTARGGRGGKAGCRGWSGGGGGGGSASSAQFLGGDIFVVAGGGGGGGGGSHNRGGEPSESRQPYPSSPFYATTGTVPASGGSSGSDKNGDGGGGGGGGGGDNVPGANAPSGQGHGGRAGQDNSSGGEGGERGGSLYNSNQATLQSQWNNSDSKGYVSLKYTGYTDQTITTVEKTIVNGATTANLKLTADHVGVQTCMCKITSATASNSPIYTDTVNVVFTSTASDNIVKVEGIGMGQTANLTTLDLNNGDFTLETNAGDVSTGQINNEWVLYSPDKDLDVEMDLYGGKGSVVSGNQEGGEGGYSRIRFTIKKNEEYVIAGLTTSINTPYVYKKGQLIACVGAGGDAGTSGKGGFAGGVDIGGERGASRGGIGGNNISAGSLSGDGSFGSAFVSGTLYPGDTQATGNNGGQTIACTKGVYWAQQGKGACDDIGTGKFRQSDGTIVTNTVSGITRGYKAGYNIIQTGGVSLTSNGGNGGCGVAGGSGTQNGSGGGGGGSGYHDGSVTVVDTRLGGSTADGKVVLRLQT